MIFVVVNLCSYGRNFCNGLEKPEKVRTSTGLEPVTSRFWCDAVNQLCYVWFTSYIISSWFIPHGEHWKPHMTSSQHQWLHNLHDTHAFAIKGMEGKRKRKQVIVGHVPLALSRIFHLILKHGEQISIQVTRKRRNKGIGLGIPATYTFCHKKKQKILKLK